MDMIYEMDTHKHTYTHEMDRCTDHLWWEKREREEKNDRYEWAQKVRENKRSEKNSEMMVGQADERVSKIVI